MFACCALLAVPTATSGTLIIAGSATVPSWVYGPFSGLVPPLGTTALGIVLAVFGLSYLAAFAFATDLDKRFVWSTVIACNIVLLCAAPLLSSDVFGYIAYSHLEAVYHLNPYLHPPAAAGSDPLVALVFWRQQPSPYGPLFSGLSYPLGLLAAPAGLWLFKAIGAAASVGTCAVIWHGSRGIAAGARNRATVLVGLSPLILVYAVGGAHIDVLVMLLASYGITRLAACRSDAGAWLVAACAIKASAAPVLCFALAGPLRRPRALLAAAVAAASTAALTLWLFGTGVLGQLGLLYTDNRYLIDYSGPSLVGKLFGIPTNSTVRDICVAAVMIVATLALVRCLRGADWVSAAGWTTLAALCCIPTLAPWYVCWLLPLAALGSSRRLTALTLAFSAFLLVAHLPLVGRALAP